MSRTLSCWCFVIVAGWASLAAARPVEPLPYRVPAKLTDAAQVLSPSAVKIDGWLGARVTANAKGRLLDIDTEPMLAGYRQKPGSHPWIGEHVGKWLHAATLAWVNTGDPALRAKLDRVAAELIACQETDGYLGTYEPDKRFGLYRGADWDVWSHKYCLIGLLTYYQYTGHEPALAACRKAADLLLATFPSKKSILAAGTHVGMAATSVLEPIVVLYRFTGDERYLAFARSIVKAWDEPNGPGIAATLLRTKRVDRTANAKAYEMLSNLVGLCELARATGDRSLLEPVQIAWDDVVANRLYLTGSASAGELFQDDHVLPNTVAAHIGETCVTTTWVQLNLQLLALTGEARFADHLERTFYNHLTAAQHPEGQDWCYYTALEGAKQYDAGITCCHSSGPRGLALVPQASYLKARDQEANADVVVVNTFETSRVTLAMGGQNVTIEQASSFPTEGRATLTVRTPAPATFGFRILVPSWMAPLVVGVNDNDEDRSSRKETGWATVAPRAWKDGDRIELRYVIPVAPIVGTHGNDGRIALQYGPFVLAYDQKNNPDGPAPAAARLVTSGPRPEVVPGLPVRVKARVTSARKPEPVPAVLVPFADAGVTGGTYRVWLRDPHSAAGSTTNVSLLIESEESRSRGGNVNGSILDGDPASFVVTFDQSKQAEDWYAVTLPEPAKVGRITFAHGRVFHDGGWFDASRGKPRVEVKGVNEKAWRTVGAIDSYPPTTATDPKGLKSGQVFEIKLSEPLEVSAIRVVGAPASGDNPAQAFSSCGEVEAFAP
jgi:DUF1680 family protein